MQLRPRNWAPILGVLIAGCDGGTIGDPPSHGKERCPSADPGRVTLHRLNRVEYNNTVRDLLGTRLRPADDFPNDDHGYGFDNNADVLSLAPVLVEQYARAAEALVEDAFESGGNPQLIACDPRSAGEEPCLREVLGRFAKRAWRRPLAADELERLVALGSIPIQRGEPFAEGVKLALRGVLSSPSFIFRVELDPVPTSMEPHALTPHELATRLSYFLWSSMPDDALTELADDGRLRDPDVLTAQVRRMLRDPKASALVDNFAGQWLLTRRLDEVSPDTATFTTWDEDLRAAMRLETQLFFRSFLEEKRSVLDMLDARYTFVNDRLAVHYGLPLVGTTEMRRVELPDSTHRGGLFTQGSILTVTSRPKRTSPVLRGKWVLEQLLCQTPPPPPPGVEGLVETPEAGSVRQRTEAHRANPACASCHATMDPIGFGMESFDGIGQWRTHDGAYAVDATGTLPDGRSFDGARQLGAVLKADPNTSACLTKRLFTYALGRGPEAYDACALEEMTKTFVTNGQTLEALVIALATAPSFTDRRGEAP